MAKPDYTLEELINHPRFKKMSLPKLEDIINMHISLNDYCELEGWMAIDKARILYKQFRGFK